MHDASQRIGPVPCSPATPLTPLSKAVPSPSASRSAPDLVGGGPASIPAVNSLLDERQRVAAGAAPVTAWLEYQHDADTSLEVRTSDSDVVTWIPRKRDGAALVEEVCGALTADTVSVSEDFFWIACEASSTRAIVKHLRKELGVDKHRIDALGYWRV